MLIELISFILYKLFPKTIKSIERSATYKATEDERQRIIEQRSKSADFELKSWVGKKVVTFGNEWEDPVFGIAIPTPTELNKDNFSSKLIGVQNVLTGETIYCFVSSLLLADNEMIEAILKLNPFERWNIRARSSNNMWTKFYALDPLTPTSTIAASLQEVGFYTPTVNSRKIP